MSEKICPIMTKGWLANKYSFRVPDVEGISDTFSLNNLPKCYRENCACWISSNAGFDIPHCGLITQKFKA